MFKLISFNNVKFGELEVFIFVKDKRIMFSDKFIRKCLNVNTNEILVTGDVVSNEDTLADVSNLFEYIKYSKVDKETRWEFEEWITEVILDCAKMI